ncbi:MAG: beta-ketoacyl-ACP synthase II [Bacteroidales bacterium]|nr:beta-ketoacyl-ACP synthase II [Bacteroidales bacterium]
MSLRRVVISGIGTINPLGNNIGEFFSNLDKGVSGAGPIDIFDTTLFKTKFACQVKGYHPGNFGLDRKEYRKLDRYSQFALIATDEAIKDSSLDLESVDKSRVGVVLGTGIGGIETFGDELRDFSAGDGTPRFSPYYILKVIANIASGWISLKYGFTGPGYATSSACASSAHALMDAFNLIRLGKADIVISGGSEAPISVSAIGGFNSAKALSVNNENMTKASRPFDAQRDGFVMGEGSGILILEEYEHAVARGAKIYAEFAGAGVTTDAYHVTAPHPEGDGAARAMVLALEEAGLSPEDVDYINAHGTSTPLGDVVELKAIKSVFGEHAYKLNISSTKSMHGHLLGASGSVEALACIHAINSGIIPPTINFENEDPEIDYNLNLTLNKAQKREVNVAISNAFGFGGQNSCIVLKKI